MIRKISLIGFMLAATFAGATILSNQLFWDPEAAQDYASRLASHPEVPRLPTSRELGLQGDSAALYDALREDTDRLRVLRSKTVISAAAVQEGAILMERKIPFIKNLILSLFGKGFKADLEELVGLEAELKEAHSAFMENDLKALSESLESSEDFSVFSGRVALPNKVTYLDLKLRAEGMRGLRVSPMMAFPSPAEASCIVNTPDGSVSLPRYVREEYFPGVTSTCIPKAFYTEPQLDELVFVLGPDWSEFEKRIKWVSDLGDYMVSVSGFVNSRRLEALEALDDASLVVSQGETLSTLLSNSSVRTALLQLPGSSSLVAATGVPKMEEISGVYDELISLMEDAEESGSIGYRFQRYNEIIGKYSYVEGLVASVWPHLEEKLREMEDLCRIYGTSCEYGGELPERLELTSRAFIEARIKHVMENQLESTATELSTDFVGTELDSVKLLLHKIEPYLSASDSLVYSDKLTGLEMKFGLAKDLQGKKLVDGMEALAFEVKEFSDGIKAAFFESNRDAALKIRAELLTVSELLKSRGEAVYVEDFEISAFSNYVDSILYYLSREAYLEELKAGYQRLLKDFASDVPSGSVCVPKEPVLGEEFTVTCSVLVNNSWGVNLDSASSVLDLPYVPKHISSQNFMGDTLMISSVSFSGKDVRVNLKDLGNYAIFNLSYESELPPADYHCSYDTEGLVTGVTCTFISDCQSGRALVPIEHPFSGRKMNSSTNYSYDGSRVLVEVACGEYTAEFYGPTVEITPSAGGFLVKNLLNSTADFMIEIPPEELPTDVPAVVGALLDPFEERKVGLPSTFSFRPEEENTTYPNETLQESELFGFASYSEAYDGIKAKLEYVSFGCVEDNVVSEVLEIRRLPGLTCINLEGLEEVKALGESGREEEAVKSYFRLSGSPRLVSFLSRSSQYENESAALLEQLASLNPVSSNIVSKYIEKAKRAHENGDYITSIYYSEYALLKSAIKLGLDFRIILAVAVLAYGIYSSRQKKEEELI